MNRIDECFARLRGAGLKGFIAYIGAGDPDLKATVELCVRLQEAGVDVLELGVPFSDPLADGLVNQLAAQRGLASGTTPAKVLDAVRELRKRSQVPIVLYIYFNLVHRAGLESFIDEAAAAGIDGLLVLDLPPEEGARYEELMGKKGLCNIYLVAPTTPEDRLEIIVKRGRGFVYYVSREGVTGMQNKVAGNIAQMVSRIRAHTELPVAVGFGISTPEHVRAVGQSADAVVVGSAIVKRIEQLGRSPALVKEVSALAGSLACALKGSGGRAPGANGGEL